MKNSMKVLFTVLLCLVFASCGKAPKEESVTQKEYTSLYTLVETKPENTLNFSAENVNVEVSDIVYGDGVTRLKVKIKNDSKEKHNVMIDDLSVNGFMTADTLYERVGINEEKETFLEIGNDWFSEFSIKQIDEISLRFHIMREDALPLANSDLLTVKTDAKDAEPTDYEHNGTEIYSENDIKIFACDIKKSETSSDTELGFYSENNGDVGFSVIADEVYVNGKSIEPVFVMRVSAGKKAYDTMLFTEKNLTKNEISDFESIKMSFKIYTDEPDVFYKTELYDIPIKRQNEHK